MFQSVFEEVKSCIVNIESTYSRTVCNFNPPPKIFLINTLHMYNVIHKWIHCSMVLIHMRREVIIKILNFFILSVSDIFSCFCSLYSLMRDMHGSIHILKVVARKKACYGQGFFF